MSIIWLCSLIQNGLATTTHSFAFQTRTVPSSLGFQRYHTGLGAHREECIPTDATTISDCWRVKSGWGLRSDQVPNGTLRTHMVNVDIQRGLWISEDLLDVGFFAGMGATSMVGGIDTMAIQVLPHLHGEITLQRHTSKKRTVWLSGQSVLYWPTMGSQIQVGWELPW